MNRFRPLFWLLLLISPMSRAEAPPQVTLPGGALEGVREARDPVALAARRTSRALVARERAEVSAISPAPGRS
jgi:hypothetical protein